MTIVELPLYMGFNAVTSQLERDSEPEQNNFESFIQKIYKEALKI